MLHNGTETHTPELKLRKSILNVILFLASIAVVVVIYTYNIKVNQLRLAGTLIITISCFLVLYLFLFQFRREVFLVNRKIFFILTSIIMFLIAVRIVADLPGRNLIFLIPFAIIPIVIRTFYDARLALFILLIGIILAGLMVPEPYEFFFMNFISGMTAIFTLTNVYKRSKLVFTGLMVFLSYIVIYFGISLMGHGTFPEKFWSDILLFGGNGLLVLISYPLILLFEKRFLFLSDTTLLELSDINQPLLRKLSEEAPGSFQHSLQVANLAEEAARAIGANPLLVRAGAMYHDIGKVADPGYYIENKLDENNPHDKLSPGESASHIINHVKSGVILAKNYKIPVQIIDFIRTHHGTTVAYFFFKKFLEANPGSKDKENEFKYPGPKPFTRETAVVMMADAVEASSRSLGNYSEDSISELVEKIIYIQEQDGQFSDVPLTFKDISNIKDSFKKRISNIYHTRISYPERV
jgi:cyclic-di-AMP phosphodiesterase PgpH